MRYGLLAVLAGGVLLLGGCSDGGSASPSGSTPAASAAVSKTAAPLPGLALASRLKPCDAVSLKELTSIIGKPVKVEPSQIGQEPQLSQGVALPKVWVAICQWRIPAYPATAVYLSMELAPTSDGARADFNATATMMKLKAPPVHGAGLGDDSRSDVDGQGDVTILIHRGQEFITLEFNGTAQPAPPASDRLRMAKTIAHLVVVRRSL
jgi:hypothetical protein